MANVNYKINSKFDAKGVTQAIKSMERLQKASKTVTRAFKALTVGVAMKAIKTATDGATEAFMKQSKALSQYNATIKKLGLEANKLAEIQKKVSRNNLFDSDSLNDATKFAASMGLTEKQIENVLKAATDLSASGIMPLDQAVKALSMSYSGNIAQLKKMHPELEKLTKDQLKQGKAVDIVGKKYEGLADQYAQTFDGKNVQWQNAMSDLKASVGSIFASMQFIAQETLYPVVNKITDWINKNRINILKAIYNLPNMLKTVFEHLKKIVSKDTLAKVGKNIIEMAKETIKTIGSILWHTLTTTINSVLQAIDAQKIWETMKSNLGFNREAKAGEILLQAIEKEANDTGRKFKDVAREAENWDDAKLDSLGIVKETDKNGNVRWLTKKEEFKLSFDKNQFSSEMNKLMKENSVSVDDLKKTLSASFFDLADIVDFDGLTKKLIEAYNRDLPPELLKALELLGYLTPDEKEPDLVDRDYSAIEWAKDTPYYEKLKSTMDRMFDVATSLSITKELLVNESIQFIEVLKEDMRLKSEELQKLHKKLEEQLKQYRISAVIYSVFSNIKKAIVQEAENLFGDIGQIISKIIDIKGRVGIVIEKSSEKIAKAAAEKVTKAVTEAAEAAGPTPQEIAALQGITELIVQIIMNMIKALVSALQEVSPSLNNVINLFSTVATAIAKVIGPETENAFKPFSDLLENIGSIIGNILYPVIKRVGLVMNPLLNALTSTIGLIADLLEGFRPLADLLMEVGALADGLAFVLRPIVAIIKGIVWFIKTIYNVFVEEFNDFIKIIYEGYNFIISIYEKIYDFFDSAHLADFLGLSKPEYKDISDFTMQKIGDSTSTNSAYTGNSASYTAERDVIVTINYNNSYVNGDATEIASNLWTEIKRASKLGLVTI